MTKEQIETYEYCTEYLKCLSNYKDKIPFGIQKYGCGTGRPSIEYKLDNMHANMYRNVRSLIDKQIESVNKIIEEL